MNEKDPENPIQERYGGVMFFLQGKQRIGQENDRIASTETHRNRAGAASAPKRLAEENAHQTMAVDHRSAVLPNIIEFLLDDLPPRIRRIAMTNKCVACGQPTNEPDFCIRPECYAPN